MYTYHCCLELITSLMRYIFSNSFNLNEAILVRLSGLDKTAKIERSNQILPHTF